MNEELSKAFDDFNAKLNPKFTLADKELILKFTANEIEQARYNEAMNNNT